MSIHIKLETAVKGAAYVFGSVSTVLMATPPSQYGATKTVLTCSIAGVLALLGFISTNYADYKYLKNVETVGTGILLGTVGKGRVDQVDTATDSQ